nr:adenylyl-sulfate kinase [uncultured Emticicia sp.]
MTKNKCLWLFGLSGAGKTTLANALVDKLSTHKVKILDGDILRKGINNNLGFSSEDRFENARRTAEIAKLFIEEGYWVVVALITPFEVMRQNNRKILGEDYIEIFIDTPIALCEQRDPKGLYAKVSQRQITNFTGIDAPFEIPQSSNLIVKTVDRTIEECVKEILMFSFSDKP